MTAATSTSEKSFFGVHFRNRIIENKKLLIVNSVLELIGLPLIAVVILYELYLNEKSSFYNFDGEGIIVVSIISIVLSLLSGMVIALFSFRYLYTKSLADMNYALPLTSRQRFTADYLSGLCIYTIPAAAAALLSLIIFGIGSAFLDLSKFWENFPRLLLLGIVVFIGMIMLYTLSVFAITCCGSPFEAVFSILAANIIIPAAVVCTFFAVAGTDPFGIIEDSILYSPVLTATSPAGLVVFFVGYIESWDIGSVYSNSSYIRWLIPTLIVIAVLLAGAYLLYRRRKAESVSKPYVYKAFYYVIVTLSVFCVLATFIVYDVSIIAGLIICGILYFLLEVISKRGFRRFGISVLRYAVTVAAVFVFCAVCDHTDGFGVSRYVPRNAAVESVSLDLYGVSGNFYLDGDIVFSDKNVISETTALHKEIVSRYFHPEKYSFETIDADKISNTDTTYSHYSCESVTITYYLRNGSAVMRSYACSSDMLDGLVTAVYLSDEYAEYQSDELICSCVNSLAQDIWYDSVNDVKENDKARVILSDKLFRDIDDKVVSSAQIRELGEAYRQDMLAMTEEEFRTAPVYGYIGIYGFEIRTTFRNTIECLEKLGFSDAEITRDNIAKDYGELRFGIYTGFEAYNPIEEIYEESRSENTIPGYVYSGSRSYTLQDTFVSYFASPSSYPSVPAKDIVYDSDFMELIDRATPVIIGESAAGALYVEYDYSVKVLFLPDTEENKELLERVYEKYIEGKAVNNGDEYYYYGDDYEYVD